MGDHVDFSRFTGRAESEEVARHNDPKRELTPPAEKERTPAVASAGENQAAARGLPSSIHSIRVGSSYSSRYRRPATDPILLLHDVQYSFLPSRRGTHRSQPNGSAPPSVRWGRSHFGPIFDWEMCPFLTPNVITCRGNLLI